MKPRTTKFPQLYPLTWSQPGFTLPASSKPLVGTSYRILPTGLQLHYEHFMNRTFIRAGKPNHLVMATHVCGRPFDCSQCGKEFSSRFKLMRHSLIHSDERRYKCPTCDRCFHRKDHLKNHQQVHDPNKSVFKCLECSKTYTSRLSYRKHTAFHAAHSGHLDCGLCGQKFSDTDQVLYHLKVHVGSRATKNPSEKKFQCDVCERRFFTRKDLKRHLVVHTGKREFGCQLCPQRFGRKDHLIRHMKKAHDPNTPRNQTGRLLNESSIMRPEVTDHQPNMKAVDSHGPRESVGTSGDVVGIQCCEKYLQPHDRTPDAVHETYSNREDPPTTIKLERNVGMSMTHLSPSYVGLYPILGIIPFPPHFTEPSCSHLSAQTPLPQFRQTFQ